MNPDERDLDFMQNEFTILTSEGNIIKRKLDLLVYGNHNGCGHSATALTVGTTAAIGAQMILDNLIQERGVLAPSSELLGKTILSEYEKMKIFVTEEKNMKTKF
jgi:saccharopine dehydrogenase-like NADP-dependent oxidoreductase